MSIYVIPGHDRRSEIRRRLMRALLARDGILVSVAKEGKATCGHGMGAYLDRCVRGEYRVFKLHEIAAALDITDQYAGYLVRVLGVEAMLYSMADALLLAEQEPGGATQAAEAAGR